MAVRVERRDRVLTVVHSRPEARNAVDPEHAEALYEAFLAFDRDDAADVAVFWGEGGAFCAGADLKRVATRDNKTMRASLDFPKDRGAVPRGPMGPSRLVLSKPAGRHISSRGTRYGKCCASMAVRHRYPQRVKGCRSHPVFLISMPSP